MGVCVARQPGILVQEVAGLGSQRQDCGAHDLSLLAQGDVEGHVFPSRVLVRPQEDSLLASVAPCQYDVHKESCPLGVKSHVVIVSHRDL